MRICDVPGCNMEATCVVVAETNPRSIISDESTYDACGNHYNDVKEMFGEP